MQTLVKQAYRHALDKQALVPIATETCQLQDNNLKFLVRILKGLQKKQQATEQANQRNPFLPYDENLYVTDITDSHVCLLNKFCVVPYHLLLVTKQYEEQDTLLTERDFEAAFQVLGQWEGICFYNSNKTAGASQSHKHLQFIPSDESSQVCPFDRLLTRCIESNPIGTVSEFPFIHRVASMRGMNWNEKDGACQLAQVYHSLLNQLLTQLPHSPGASSIVQETMHSQVQSNPFSYNLALTRNWMYIVPRSIEEYEGIAVNTLGMLGTLLVSDPEKLEKLKQWGPLFLLHQVSFPRN